VTYSKEYYQKNKEKELARHAKYVEENRGRIREYDKEWYEKNREKILARKRAQYQKTKDAQRAKAKKWREDNPDQVRSQSAVKRARKANAESEPWTHEEIAAKGTGFCPYCGKVIGTLYNSKVMEIDHIIPLSREGSNLIENLEAICASCNASKHDKTKEEFLNVLKTEKA
jgi:5-methylcytosine-specific restriction endonuclease McrA